MSHDRIVMMANQIATFFASQRKEDQAGRVASHLKDFWAPEMRAALIAKIDAGETGLHPLARQAAGRLREPAGA